MRIWTEEDDLFLAENYFRMNRNQMAKHFGITTEEVAKRCHKIGITSKRHFTKAEEEYILEHYGTMTISAIALKLGRSRKSVADKTYRLGLGGFIDNSDWIHLAEVSRMVHRNKCTIKEIWTKYGLKIKKKGRYSMISQENLAEVMENNPQLYDATECDDYFRFYGWFNEKLIADREKKYDRKGA